MVEGPFPAAQILLVARQSASKAVIDPNTAAAKNLAMSSPAQVFGHMAGLNETFPLNVPSCFSCFGKVMAFLLV